LKKKLFCILFALTLAVSLMLVPAVVSANPGAIQVTTHSNYDRNPSIVVLDQAIGSLSAGDWVVFFTRGQSGGVRDGYNPDADTYDIYYKSYNVSASSWLTTTQVTGHGNHDQRDVAALQDDSGDIWLFSFDGGGGSGNVYYTTTTDLSSWTAWTQVSGASGGHGDAVVDNSGDIWLFLESGAADDTYCYSGSSWSAKTSYSASTTPDLGYMPKATIADNGDLVVASINAGGTHVYVSRSAGGTSWTKKVDIDTSASYGYDPNIVQDSLDAWWVFYAPWDSTNDCQWIEYRTASSISGLDTASATTICAGYSGSNYWWDFWPEPFEDAGGVIQLLYTSESNADGNAMIDANIWIKEVASTGGVALEVEVPEIVAISVTPSSIDFGTMYPGESSDVTVITIKNVGTEEVDVAASLDPTGTVFDDNLKLDTSYTVGTWGGIIDLGASNSDTVDAQLDVPSDHDPKGEETTTLIFEASTS
jgi:hypothetical protein